MLGALIGDMVGAPYEFDMSPKIKNFGPLFIKDSHFTDDSVMTVAVAKALMDAGKDADEETVKSHVIREMQRWGQRYPNAGYGSRFIYWLYEKPAHPYGSFGNGSAMRVSAAGWLYDTLQRTREVARWTAEVSHNHPEGIKGAEAVASVIFLGRTDHSKEEIKDYVTHEFHYDLSRTCDEIRPGYYHDESCQKTVPEAFTAFLEGENFEDVLRTAVSLGGDCDTLSDIACAMAESMYHIPISIELEARKREPEEFIEVVDRFYKAAGIRKEEHDESLEENGLIEKTIDEFYQHTDQEHLVNLLTAIRLQADRDGRFLVPVQISARDAGLFDPDKNGIGDTVSLKDDLHLQIQTVNDSEGNTWWTAFTSEKERDKGQPTSVINSCIHDYFGGFLVGHKDLAGIVINPWDKPVKLTRKLIESIEQKSADSEDKDV